MIRQPLGGSPVALPSLVRCTTVFFLVAATAALPMLAGPRAAASERSPLVALEPGLDTRCVAEVTVDSARLLRAVPQWWSRDFKWEGVRFACEKPTPEGIVPFSWDVAGLGIAGRGEIVSADHRTVQWQWHLSAEKPWPVEGEPGARQPHGGLTFFLDLKSPARPHASGDSVYRPTPCTFTRGTASPIAS
jgi:hypothetical protein